MLNKLAALSDEALFKLKAQVDEAVTNRKRKLLAPGRMATFASHKTGETIRIKILSRGPKNYSGYRIHDDGRHDMLAKWRVHPDFLTPYFEPKKVVVAPTGTGSDRPASTGVAAF